MKPRALTYEQECEIYDLLEQRRALSNKKLMIRFRISQSVLYRIQRYGPSDSRETERNLMIDDCLRELKSHASR